MTRRLLLATMLLLCAAPASADAFTIKERTFRVEITAIHDVMWSFKSDTFNQRCKGWTEGSGTQVTGMSTGRPMTYRGREVVGEIPKKYERMARYSLLGPMKPAKWRATVERQTDWRTHGIAITPECTGCGPLSEYGPCKDVMPPIQALQRCGRKAIERPAASLAYQPLQDTEAPEVVTLADVLQVELTAPTAGLYAYCGPEEGDIQRPDPLPLAVPRAQARKMWRLPVGRKLTLKASDQAGTVVKPGANASLERCTPKTLVGLGYRECATTQATIEVTRTR